MAGISDEQVEAALDAAGHRSTEYSRAWMSKALEAALLPRPVEAGVPTHKHLKSGHLVRVIGLGRMQSANWRTCPFGQGITSSFDAPVDMREVVIYEHDGDLWVRPVEEFNDGRFETLPTSPATGDEGC